MLAITTGLVLAGIPGALIAVPLVAMLNTAVRSLLAEDPEAISGEVDGDVNTGELMFPAESDDVTRLPSGEPGTAEDGTSPAG